MKQPFLIVALCLTLALPAGVSVLAGEQRETPLVRAVKRVAPSVVNIHTEKSAQERDSVFTAGKSRKINGMGTGVVFDDRGYVVTNYHVIAEVEVIRCSFENGNDYDARVVSFDREHDLAVIKLDPSKSLTVCPMGTSSDLMLGETVIALGNAYGYRHTITSGIVSALGRDVEVNDTQSYRNLIQTDASINPGNSGGPLINLDGDVVGINVAIRAGAQRIGFAIPIDDARKIIARLISSEQLSQSYHGVVAKDVKCGQTRHLLVEQALPDSPAAMAGLKSGDIITKIGNLEVVDGADLERAMLGRAIGEKVAVNVKRGDTTETIDLSLVASPHGRSAMAMEVVGGRATKIDDPAAEQYWKLWGLKLQPLPTAQRQLIGSRYRGGMRVVEVRSDSPASLNGISKGDILVGLHDWETVKFEDVNWIVNKTAELKLPSVKFFIVRGQETLFGHLQVASR